MILVVHIDDIVVWAGKVESDGLHRILNDTFPSHIVGQIGWYVGCSLKQNWDMGCITMKQSAFVDTLLARCDIVTARSDAPVTPAADLGPTTRDNTVVIDHPFRHGFVGAMWRAETTRPDIANEVRAVARHSHDPVVRGALGGINEDPRSA